MFDISTAVAAGMTLESGSVVETQNGLVLVRLHSSEDELIKARMLRVTDGPPPKLTAGDDVLIAHDPVLQSGYVIGVVDKPEEEARNGESDRAVTIVRTDESNNARITGKRILIEAGEELQIKCGDAMILINRNGKIVVKGESITSRARGVNKIKGAAVAIN